MDTQARDIAPELYGVLAFADQMDHATDQLAAAATAKLVKAVQDLQKAAARRAITGKLRHEAHDLLPLTN